jgi:TonB-dependent starch-binding outer membrane protein SusC
MTFKTNSALRVCLLVCLVLTSSLLFAQKKIAGRIISNTDKQPLSGATVQVKGGKLATQIPVAGRSTLGDISLAASAFSLNEAVVTGYATQKKKDLTGAVFHCIEEQDARENA